MNVAVLLLACLGATWIVTRSVIMAPLRRLFPKPRGTTPFMGTLVRCPQCAGFWIGAAMSLRLPAGSALELAGNAAVMACASSALGHAAQVLLARLGEEPPDDDDEPPAAPPPRLA